MTGPHPSVAATRAAVRRALADVTGPVVAAVSGGADSLALAAALAFESDPSRPASLPVQGWAVVVDHGLQDGSAGVAEQAARTCRRLGLEARVVTVEVASDGGGGPEARAREARYAALADVAADVGAQAVLLGHTRDDQAEQVLLGLARGSGARSLSGMPPQRGLYRRPLLGVSRATTREACAAQGLTAWEDPHNADPRYLRTHARALLAEVERLSPGVGAALARSADLLRDDADALDAIADRLVRGIGDPPWSPRDFADHPAAVRRRMWRRVLLDAGVPAGSLGSGHLAAADALVSDWHGQGPVHLPGGHRLSRVADPPRLVHAPPLRPPSAPTPVPGPATSDPGVR